MEKTIFLILCPFVINAQIIVKTQYGPIRGAQRTSQLNSTYFSFQKIPYMRPPVGFLRFRDPVQPESWTEPLDCTQQGPRFPQVDATWEPPFAQFRGDLDSMHVNVFTKNLTPSKKLPVLVWIHGGGFRTGSGLTEIYGPDYFMERDVILVTFNYRLYAYGFISFDDPSLRIPGNAGFKDQVMALKWVKENIENFGGDSQNITIFGQSSGGGCVHYHMISPASKNLFERAIIMAGSAFNPMYSAIPRRNWAFRLAQMNGYQGPEIDQQILEFLETLTPQQIFISVGNIMTDHEKFVERLINAFGPVIEPYDNGNAFMLAHPEKLAKTAWGNQIDVMIGSTSFENGALVPFAMRSSEFSASLLDFPSWVPYMLNKSEEEKEYFGEKLRETYYGQIEPEPTGFEAAVILSSDFAFWHVNDRVVKQRLRDNPQAKNWVYRFDVDSDNNCFRRLRQVPEAFHSYRRAIHMDELCYLFKPSFVPVPETGSESFEVIQRMLDIFTNFASNGNPGIENWAPSTDSEHSLIGYNIRENDILSEVGILPEMSHMHVWQEMYPTTDSANGVKLSILIIFISLIFTQYL